MTIKIDMIEIVLPSFAKSRVGLANVTSRHSTAAFSSQRLCLFNCCKAIFRTSSQNTLCFLSVPPAAVLVPHHSYEADDEHDNLHE